MIERGGGLPLIRKKQMENGKIRRYIDQVCFVYRKDGCNIISPVVLNEELKEKILPELVLEKFERVIITPFSEEGGNED